MYIIILYSLGSGLGEMCFFLGMTSSSSSGVSQPFSNNSTLVKHAITIVTNVIICISHNSSHTHTPASLAKLISLMKSSASHVPVIHST